MNKIEILFDRHKDRDNGVHDFQKIICTLILNKDNSDFYQEWESLQNTEELKEWGSMEKSGLMAHHKKAFGVLTDSEKQLFFLHYVTSTIKNILDAKDKSTQAYETGPKEDKV